MTSSSLNVEPAQSTIDMSKPQAGQQDPDHSEQGGRVAHAGSGHHELTAANLARLNSQITQARGRDHLLQGIGAWMEDVPSVQAMIAQRRPGSDGAGRN